MSNPLGSSSSCLHSRTQELLVSAIQSNDFMKHLDGKSIEASKVFNVVS